jgi:hypothetical protein
LVSILLSWFRQEWRRYSATSAIGHAAGHILETCAKDLANCLNVAQQLLFNGGSLVEADGVVIVVVGAGDRDGLGLNLGVEPNDLSRVAFRRRASGRRSGRRTKPYLWWMTRS